MIIKQIKILLTISIVFILPLINFSCDIAKNNNAESRSIIKIDSRLNETAMFLAGRDISEASKLSPYTQGKYYKTYKKQMDQGWNKFQEPNLQKIKTWWKKYSPKKYNKNILYPFSGPDIMNALNLFPDGKLYIMFGLEQPGIIPDPYELSNKQITAGLTGMKRSLGTILKMNFFRTKGMKRNLGNQSFNGIAGLIMFFLSINDYIIIDAHKIAIDANSKIVPWQVSDDKIKWENPPKSKRIPGVEISFKKKSGKIQKIRYFMLNVIDYSLKKHSPNFIPYIKNSGPYTTVLKSASYLMHNDKIKFTKIRAAVLSSTNYLIQDDSGVPLRYFPEDTWELKFHGYYYKPIPLFSAARRLIQLDLRKTMKKLSTGILPFGYGYNIGKGQANLMTAKRKVK